MNSWLDKLNVDGVYRIKYLNYLDTKDLKSKGISGVLWGGIQNGSVFIIRLILSMVLARLLSPQDYGLIGAIMVFVPITTAFVDSGFRQGLIQAKEANDIDYHTINTFNVVISVFFYTVLFVSMPFISRFYNEPDLVSIGRVLFVGIILSAFMIIHDAYLIKNFKFKATAKINVLASSIAGVVGIIFAFLNFGVWALVIRNLSTQVIKVFAFYKASDIKIRFRFNVDSFKRLSKFSISLLVTGVMDQVFRNINQVIIGRFYSTYLIGIYDRAKYIYQIPINVVDQSFKNISFPMFSSIQDNDEVILKGLKKILQAYVFVLYPILSIGIVFSKTIVIILLSEKWIEVVPLLKAFLVIGFFFPFATLNENVLKAKGFSSVILKNFLIVQSIAVVLIFLVVKFEYSIVYLISILIIGQILFFLINGYALNKKISYPIINQLLDIKIYVIAVMISVSISIVLISLFSISNQVCLVALSMVSFAVYVGICYLFNDNVIMEIVSQMKNKVNGKKR